MIQIILVCLFMALVSYASLASTISDKVDKIVSLDTNENTKIYFILNMDICVGCNLAKMNAALHQLKKEIGDCKLILVVESKYKNDSHYLKKEIKSDAMFEDNTQFLTKATNSNFVLIVRRQEQNMYFTLNNIAELRSPDFKKYITNQNNFSSICQISEGEDSYLSKIEVINDQSTLKIFDYQNKNFFTYDTFGKIINSQSFDSPYMFYIGEKSVLDSLERSDDGGLTAPTTIRKIQYIQDTLSILYVDMLHDLKIFGKITSIYTRAFLLTYHNDKLVRKILLDIAGYQDYFKFNNHHYLETFIFPEERTAEAAIYSELNYDSLQNFKPKTISINSINQSFAYNLKSPNDIFYKANDTKGNILFIFKNNDSLSIMNAEKATTYKIQMQGIIKRNDDVIISDFAIEDNNLYLLLRLKNYMFVQKYDMKSNSLAKEYSYFSDEELITTKFFSIGDKSIQFVNRWINKRWTKDRLMIN